MKTVKSSLTWGIRFIGLYVLFIVLFIIGTLPLASVIPPAAASEPGLMSPTGGLLIVAFAHGLVIAALILTSRWNGWRLAASLALAYYGAVTFLTQIETWYFLSSLTVDPQVLLRLFGMGIPTAFLFIPLAVWILGKGRPARDAPPERTRGMSIDQWIGKLAALVLVYIALYWGAGYFVAWQNPELRAFYGQPGEALPFFTHTLNTLRQDPLLFPFQALRALLWVLCALPVIYGSRVNAWWTALLVGLLFSVPQNVGHVLANPLMPVASVRLTHMIETASSTFVFGLIVVWLLHRQHRSFGDLMGIPGSRRAGAFKDTAASRASEGHAAWRGSPLTNGVEVRYCGDFSSPERMAKRTRSER
jgi:hypothetical protein